ncbi:hypothetical protein [Tabrizicola aquatica]|uniref:hypothetical protein n=1 Tax=Tabrizicola aquatica TaxID=909926 RepID=UPI000CD26A31|nr:hypothetical protein [Tabrizicola aquatica]
MWKVILTVAVLSAGRASACPVLEPFDMAQIGGAELVLIGEVTAYEQLGGPLGGALVTVAVEEVLKGRSGDEVTFIWNRGMAQGPHEVLARGRVLIGAMRGGRLVVTSRVPDMRPDLPSIIQPYCGEVWMQPATTRTVAAAREALE